VTGRFQPEWWTGLLQPPATSPQQAATTWPTQVRDEAACAASRLQEI
jgi:hypothetical protein